MGSTPSFLFQEVRAVLRLHCVGTCEGGRPAAHRSQVLAPAALALPSVVDTSLTLPHHSLFWNREYRMLAVCPLPPKRDSTLKPQDLVVLLKLMTIGKTPWTFASLAHQLGMAASEVHASVQRAATCHLYEPTSREVAVHGLAELLVHGVRYVFPAVPGALARGLPTAHSAPALSRELRAADDSMLVWPSEPGRAMGQSLAPLHPSAPAAAAADPALYELLALVDSLRVGRPRERAVAAAQLQKRLGVA